MDRWVLICEENDVFAAAVQESSNEAESGIIALATKWQIRAAARRASHKWVADTILRSQDSIEIELAADGVCDASI